MSIDKMAGKLPQEFSRVERLPAYVFNITTELKMSARRRTELKMSARFPRYS